MMVGYGRASGFLMQQVSDKFVICEMGIRPAYSVDLCHLSRRKLFVGIQAPSPLEQALSAQDFVYTRDTPAETVCRVKDGCVHVSHFNTFCQKCIEVTLAG